MCGIKKKLYGKKPILALIVILLFINLPLASALEISNVRVEDVTENSAVIKWETDEPADSFVNYGLDKENLEKVGDAKQITEHSLPLTNLSSEKKHWYSVESGDLVDDNSGNFYTFSTLAPDTTPPELTVEIQEMVAGIKLDIVGWTEVGAEVNLYVNGDLAGSTVGFKEEEKEIEVEEAFPAEEEEGEETIAEEPEIKVEEAPTEEELTEEITTGEETAIAGGAISSLAAEQKTKPAGKFTFSNVIIEKDNFNQILIEAIDKAGNKATFEAKVFSDSSKPKLELEETPEIISDNLIELNGKVSENVTYEIFVNGKSVAKGEGKAIKETINLKEGKNKIKVAAKDLAGWEAVEELEVTADTQIPFVKFTIEKGKEYYQGKTLTPRGGYKNRAESDIHGETEPGAAVYLYVYRQIGYEYVLDFKRARAKVTADKNGSFTFKEVNFEEEPISLKDLAPKQVPSGLQEFSIFPIEQIAEQQRFTYYVFVIAEDKTGKTGYAQTTVTINTCYSANLDFGIQSLAQFQRPLRLDPGLLDEGREQVTAVFNFSYRGHGSAKLDVATGQELEKAFEITSVQFDRACTQSMMEDEAFKLGCNILPPNPRKISNADKTAWYLTYQLHSAEKLSETKESYWNEFMKRQLVFPLKIRVGYRERGTDGNFGPVKTQTSCYDLSYFVDIPIDSKDMLPDWMADEGLEAISATIEQIDNILPYLEKAIMVTGVGCITSFLGRMATRWVRIFTSRLEFYFTKTKPEGEKCPNTAGQSRLLLESTIDQWGEIGSIFAPENQPKGDWSDKEKSLDKLCPWTAGMWKIESGLDQAYKWTCDRVFCRGVPAGWTAEKEKEEVDTVILSQQQCTVSSRGVPLIEVENCNEIVQQDVTNPSEAAVRMARNGSKTCYRYNDRLYVVTTKQEPSEVGEVIKLRMVHDFGLSIQQGSLYVGASDLFAYRPPNSENFIVGQDKSCKHACKNPRKQGYKAAVETSIPNYADENAGSKAQHGCYREVQDPANPKNVVLEGKGGKKTGTTEFSAGYTKDCFIEFDKTGSDIKIKGPNQETGETGLLQCVCTVDKEEERVYAARTAAKEQSGKSEDWIYRQAEVFKDSNHRFGTYYPKWRYYSGRDFSSAFGADYLIDYLRPKDKEQVHEVNPHSQFLGVYQTVCLSGVRAHLNTLKSILLGLKNCIEQAKITGLHDAGVCKTIFSQHVCGLMYKAIAYFFTDCSPRSFSDETKGGAFESISEAFGAGFGSLGEAMQSSIDDIKSDYGNAKLNQFFATGAQGFAQSMCMAAFGYDWPLGMDFILDSAYAFPMKTTAMVFPAERELATFNPVQGTAVFNYNVGALVLPGCQIKSADVYLKCVGPEDLGHPGIQCKNQGCDCLHTTEQTAVEGEKIKYLDKGRLFDLKPGSFVDLKIPAPQKVDANYRYDHVVIDLKLDPYEEAANCFDEGYRDGKFYFPITDTSAPAEFVCQLQPATGRYFCPEVQQLFGAGAGAYLEDPYISCFDKDTQSWVSCQTPNLFVKNNPIRVKTHVMTDGEQYCLKLTASGLGPQTQELGIRQLPQKLPGPFGIEANLGTVNEGMFGGVINTLQLVSSESDPGCSAQLRFDLIPQTPLAGTKKFAFSYSVQNGQYRIVMPPGVVPDGPHKAGVGNVLQNSAGQEYLSPTELQQVRFNLEGFKVFNIIGSPQGARKTCTYQIVPAAGQALVQNQRPISVTAELLMPDAGGSCFNANIPVKAPAFGRAKHTESIILQLEKTVSQITSKMHQEFIKGNCQFVQQNAKEIINRQKNDLEDAIAIYYSAACYVISGGTDWATQFKPQVCTLLDIFFNRSYQVLGTKGQPYPPEVNNTVEYQKIGKYLEEIKNKAACST